MHRTLQLGLRADLRRETLIETFVPHLYLQLAARNARAHKVTHGLQRASRRLRSHQLGVLRRTSCKRRQG